MNALYLNTKSRALNVFTVSVTLVENKGLVIRFGANLGPLWTLVNEDKPLLAENFSLPIIVPTSGYQARNSAGFVEVVKTQSYMRWAIDAVIVGFQGMPWQNNKALAPVNPLEVIVCPPGTSVYEINTHNSGDKRHSNSSTASAAMEGLRLMVGLKNSIIIAEGQSDTTQAWSLDVWDKAKNPSKWEPKYPNEHKAEVFSWGNIARKTFGPWGIESQATKFIMVLMASLSHKLREKGHYYNVSEFVSTNFLRYYADNWWAFEKGSEELLNEGLSKGWDFRYIVNGSGDVRFFVYQDGKLDWDYGIFFRDSGNADVFKLLLNLLNVIYTDKKICTEGLEMHSFAPPKNIFFEEVVEEDEDEDEDEDESLLEKETVAALRNGFQDSDDDGEGEDMDM